MSRHSKFQVDWQKAIDHTGVSSEIQVSRDGKSNIYTSLDDLPDDVRELLKGLQPSSERRPITHAKQLQSYSSNRRLSRKRRPYIELVGARLVVEYRWFAWWALLLPFFACPFLFIEAWKMQNQPSMLWKLAGWCGLLVGCAMLYFVAASFVNRTIIEVCKQCLSVRHGPLPWFGSRAFATANIKQVFCRIVRSGFDTPRTYYQLTALTHKGEITLLDHMHSAADVVAIEQAIETHLGITDWSNAK